MCVNISKFNMFQHSKVSQSLDPAAILASVMMMNLVFIAIKYEIHDYFQNFLEIAPWLSLMLWVFTPGRTAKHRCRWIGLLFRKSLCLFDSETSESADDQF